MLKIGAHWQMETAPFLSSCNIRIITPAIIHIFSPVLDHSLHDTGDKRLSEPEIMSGGFAYILGFS